MSALLLRLSQFVYRRVCAQGDGWIWRDNHRGEHARCYHANRQRLQVQTNAHYADLAPQWASPCPVCGVAL